MREGAQQRQHRPEGETAGEVLEEILRRGAQKLLQLAIEQEVEEFVERYRELKREDGHRMVVRNGYIPERTILSGLGAIRIKQPRVDDRQLREEQG